MDLFTSYFRMRLNTRSRVDALPLMGYANAARELQKLGAGAIVMSSLFEEQN